MTGPIPRLLRHSRYLRTLRRAWRDPPAAQARVLRSLLRRAAATDLGRRHGFGELAREADVFAAYRERVPLTTYDDYREAIAAAYAGEPGRIWPGRCDFFATSAGTTAAARTLPVSRETLGSNYAFGAAALLSHVVGTGRTGCLGGSPLALTGAIHPLPGRPEARQGEISGLLAHHLLGARGPLGAIRRRKILPPALRDLTDWDEKIDRIADWALARDVRVFAGVPGWGLGLFERVLERCRERHGRRVETLGEIWPRLELVIGGGAPLAPYRDTFRERIGLPRVDFVETYGASEGFVAFQSAPDDPALALHLDAGVFFELVPEEDLGAAAPRRHTVADAELGVRYALHLASASGFFSYPLGDVVRLTSLDPPKLVVAGRTVDALDSYGEDLTGEQARAALAATCAGSGARVRHLHVSPRPAAGARRHALEWLIEFDAAPADPQGFAAELDRALREVSPTYDACRREKGFGPPVVTALPRGAVERWLRAARGGIGAQTKVPLMSEGREIADVLGGGDSGGGGGAA